MKKTLATYDIVQELLADKYAKWTPAGARALAIDLQLFEEDTGEEMEFDVTALRCEYSEYGSFEDFRKEYFANPEQCWDEIGADDDAEEDELDELTREYIESRGNLIEFDGGIIVEL